MGIIRSITTLAAGAALFGMGYVSGCAGNQDKDFRIMRDQDRAGFEHVYLQDRHNTDRIYEIMKSGEEITLQDYQFRFDSDKLRESIQQTPSGQQDKKIKDRINDRLGGN